MTELEYALKRIAFLEAKLEHYDSVVLHCSRCAVNTMRPEDLPENAINNSHGCGYGGITRCYRCIAEKFKREGRLPLVPS